LNYGVISFDQRSFVVVDIRLPIVMKTMSDEVVWHDLGMPELEPLQHDYTSVHHRGLSCVHY
jgi:hypothetical protein